MRSFATTGFYGDALPTGEYAVLVLDAHMTTHLGEIPLPGQNVLFVRITNKGGFKMAGQGHVDGKAWEWTQATGQWHVADEVALGVSPVIYDNNGTLIVSHGGPVGSQGYRFVDASNTPHTGDNTYADTVNHIFEWTDYAGYRIGQGEETGCHIITPDKKHHLLEDGESRFVRVHGEGTSIAVTVCKFAQRLVSMHWLDLAEIATLQETAAVQPAPHPTPKPEPPKEPTPMALQAPDLHALVNKVHADHPEVRWDVDVDDVRGVGVDWFCHEANLLDPRAPWGRKARNKDGSRKNGDAAVFLRLDGMIEIYDIITGAGGPSWGKPSGPIANGANGWWFAANPVSAPQPTPEPEPTPVPTPVPTPEPSPLVDIEKASLTELQAIHAELIGIRKDLNTLGDSFKKYLPFLLAILGPKV